MLRSDDEAAFPSAEQLRATCPPRAPGTRVWLGFSGGGDSTALLHALAQSGLDGLHAIHVDHGLQPVSGAWAAHAGRICAALDVPLRIAVVNCDRRSGLGLEAAARNARRMALMALMATGDIVLTAHHRDDQIETVLLRLLRGTGIEGLAAMRPTRAFGRGTLWRPLLETSRSAVREYLSRSGLPFIDDPHNTDPRLARARLRGRLLPLLRAHIPDLDARLAKLATIAAVATDRIADDVRADLAVVGSDHPRIADLLALGDHRRRAALRCWLTDASGGLPPQAALLERIERELIRSRRHAEPQLAFGALRLRRHRDRLRLTPTLPAPPRNWIGTWHQQPVIDLPPGAGRLVADRPPPRPLTLRFATGGERIRPAGRPHRRTLKNLLREAEIPAWERPFMPLLYDDDRLLAVADRWHTEEWQLICATSGWEYRWEPAFSDSAL